MPNKRMLNKIICPIYHRELPRRLGAPDSHRASKATETQVPPAAMSRPSTALIEQAASIFARHYFTRFTLSRECVKEFLSELKLTISSGASRLELYHLPVDTHRFELSKDDEETVTIMLERLMIKKLYIRPSELAAALVRFKGTLGRIRHAGLQTELVSLRQELRRKNQELHNVYRDLAKAGQKRRRTTIADAE